MYPHYRAILEAKPLLVWGDITAADLEFLTTRLPHQGLAIQPVVESVRTEGETSVFVLEGQPVSRVDKVPAGGEVRVHEHFGGSSREGVLDEETSAVATAAVAAASRLRGADLAYARVDLMRLADGALAVSELELIEPGLYLDVVPGNAARFARAVAARL